MASEQKNKKTALVTGGLGFIGSHIVDALINRGTQVYVLDNLSNGKLQNVKQWKENSLFHFIKEDLLNTPNSFPRLSFDTIFHLAANPEVRVSATHPEIHFKQNVLATFNLLEYIRETQQNPTFIFASTSAVYGEPLIIPTPEFYAPLKPISIYAATKLACEALIIAYAHNYGFKAVIYRLANIIGPRSNHGVIYDFIKKLQKNPTELEILGDGTQTKSYLYVEDCVSGLLFGVDKTKNHSEIYNVGSEDQINVKTIGQTVIEEMGLKNTKTKLTGGVEGGRGWKGDVKVMLLDINKIKSIGWKPQMNSHQAVRQTTKDLIQNST